ncbi:hypothetical protein [Nocardia sp. NPDC052316]|uniref:hypothetical protein n=1 Tax=Nocardia sp. NPDC052316 TaxID=3364329 RepID=UPI0037C563F6
MSKLITATALLISTTVAASACTSAQTDPAPASPVEQVAFPKSLSAQDQETIAYRDTLRPLDPCGYMDDATVRRIGTPAYVGALFDFNTCVASFKSPEGDLLGSVNLVMGGVTGTAVDEITYSPNPPGDKCAASVRIDDRLSIMVFAHDGLDRCGVVRDVAESVAAHRPERALRATSPRAHVNSRLAALDPCAVLGKIGQGRRPALLSGDTPSPPRGPNQQNRTNPWACSFQLDNGDASTTQDVRYKFTSARFTAHAGNNEKEIRIGELPALEISQPNDQLSYSTCSINISTTPQPTASRPDPHNPLSDSGSSEIISIEAAGGCAAARATAEEIVRLYHQLPH